jgi:hypothetical protein
VNAPESQALQKKNLWLRTPDGAANLSYFKFDSHDVFPLGVEAQLLDGVATLLRYFSCGGELLEGSDRSVNNVVLV